MVDVDRGLARLVRLEELIERLEDVRGRGLDTYLADEELRARTERYLEVAIQICIDLATQIMVEQSAKAPSSYSGVFETLGAAGALPADLADSLAAAARQRNLLVHLYLDVDDRIVFASLDSLDDLRRFSAFAASRLDG